MLVADWSGQNPEGEHPIVLAAPFLKKHSLIPTERKVILSLKAALILYYNKPIRAGSATYLV